MVDSKRAGLCWLGAAALAGLAFAGLSAAVARGKLSRFDRGAKQRIRALRARAPDAPLVDVLARASGPIGKWWAYLPASFATARRLEQRGRGVAALTVAGTAVAAALLPPLLERWLPHRAPPPERGEPGEQSYPSGHALQTAALALATNYVLRREGLTPRWSSGPFALAPALAAGGKLLLERHWASDVLGGYLAGVALGSACVGGYELLLQRRSQTPLLR